jgi:hypothetical protein
MRAALIHSTGTLWLAGNPATAERLHSSAANLRIEGRTALQQDARVRAAATLHIDRGNLATTVSFDTSRIFSTPAEAEVWSGMYDTANPRTGTLVLASISPVNESLLFFHGAVVQPPRRQVIGCSVLLGYEVLCGAAEYSTVTIGGTALFDTGVPADGSLLYAGTIGDTVYWTTTGEMPDGVFGGRPDHPDWRVLTYEAGVAASLARYVNDASSGLFIDAAAPAEVTGEFDWTAVAPSSGEPELTVVNPYPF